MSAFYVEARRHWATVARRAASAYPEKPCSKSPLRGVAFFPMAEKYSIHYDEIIKTGLLPFNLRHSHQLRITYFEIIY